MYVVAHHTILDPEGAFARGTRLMAGDGAPVGTRVIQFYPSRDHSQVICLWESSEVGHVQAFVDEVLGETSDNVCFPVDDGHAFSERALGLPEGPPAAAPRP